MGKINFAEVEQPKAPEPIPAGKYSVRCSGAEKDEVKNGPNAGAPLYKFEFEVQDPGEDNDGRKVWDNMSLIPPHTDGNGKQRNGTYWRAQQLLRATGNAANEELDLDDLDGDGLTFEDHMLGQELVLDVGIRQARTNPETGQEYRAQNTVKAFLPESEDGNSLP